jgi:methylase of polypeptide subunit release factors
LVGEGIAVLYVAHDAWLVRGSDRLEAMRVLESSGWRSDPAIAADAMVHPRGGVLQIGIVPPIDGISARRRRRLASLLWSDAVSVADGWLVPSGETVAEVGEAERRVAVSSDGFAWSFREARRLHAEGYGWVGRSAARVSFAGVTFIVPRGVYPAKRVTEGVVKRCLDRIDEVEAPIVADIGTGAGVVAISLALARPDARVVAVDRSPRAARAARKNARIQRANVSVRVGDLLGPLPPTFRGRVHSICANVPYVTPWGAADPGYAAPRSTVAGVGPDGLGLIRQLAETARGLLARDGVLVFQLADSQWEGLRDDLASLGYRPEDPDVRNPGHAIVASALWMEKS